MVPRTIRIEGDVAYVPLTKGYEAVIDAADVPLVEGRNWFARVYLRKDGVVRNVYALRNCTRAGEWKMQAMHRLICPVGEGCEVDHLDGNGLNNRRINLRSATRAQNQFNQRLALHNTSGVKGVSWDKRSAKWQARIHLNGKNQALGYYDSIAEAATAYAAASAQLHGDFGRAARNTHF